ncbi:MAG: gamma-glutamylcyclotransferase [Comamonadaceae bacterium]|nr:MAG: gamma-glutamylcyclotransferase [Comamonadaceae bacterium]
MLDVALREWGGQDDLWVFGYASLIWRPEFEFAERRLARVHGWHRALKMWSRVNRGTPECPGLVFALLSGGSCQGVVFRVPQTQGHEVMERLWQREMISGVYDPKWLPCQTDQGPVRALAFTLSRRHPSFTGDLEEPQYRQILCDSCGRFGTTLDYAQQTYDGLLQLGIRDHELERVLHLRQT